MLPRKGRIKLTEMTTSDDIVLEEKRLNVGDGLVLVEKCLSTVLDYLRSTSCLQGTVKAIEI